MAKLLSQEEVIRLSALMAAEYGLPPPRIIEEESYYGSDNWRLKVKMFRRLKVNRSGGWPFNVFKKEKLLVIKDYYANDYEDALTTLERELAKLNGRTTVADHYREKFAMQEADQALNEVLRETPIV